MVYQGVADYEYRNGKFPFRWGYERFTAFSLNFYLFCACLFSMLEKIINLCAKTWLAYTSNHIISSGARIHEVHQANFVWGRFWGTFLSLCSLRGGLIFCNFCYFLLV